VPSGTSLHPNAAAARPLSGSLGFLPDHCDCEDELWQPRFFDHALRTVKEHNEKIDYVHLIRASAGLVSRAGMSGWSSYHGYGGMSAPEQKQRCGLIISRVRDAL
jgi:hypothetical protein